MDIDTIIKQWFALSQGQETSRGDIFFQFVALWIAFNAMYASQDSDDVGDWDQIATFAGDGNLNDLHNMLLRNPVYERAISRLREKGVFDTATGKRRKIRNPKNLVEVMRCLYQVRCNLFHGGKMPENPRDERLVEASHTILTRLLAERLGVSGRQETMFSDLAP